MKKVIKKLIAYDKLYNLIKTSFIYSAWKKANGKLANMMYGNPSRDFFVIGITGTNGKTTTANIVHKILNDNLAPTVLISTANIKIWNKEIHNDTKMTSLDIFKLQELLASAKAQGCKIAVLEVSSHGIEQQRFDGVSFDAAMLTNITHDHLDYHGSMHNYAEVKKRLFKMVIANNKKNKIAIFPKDDKIGREWFDHMPFEKKVSYAITSSAMMKAENIQERIDWTDFVARYLGKEYPITTKLPGSFNVNNILAALSLVTQMGLTIPEATKSIAEFEWISGRMQHIHMEWIDYFIDFAHTPDALDKTLKYLAHIKKGRLIVVAGATGNRDRAKRPWMGKIVERYSNIMIATDEDPDTENRMRIISEFVSEVSREEGEGLFIIPERADAIKFAVEIAQPWDIVMCAGKGHEKIMLTKWGKRKWNDRDEVVKNIEIKRILNRRAKEAQTTQPTQ